MAKDAAKKEPPPTVNAQPFVQDKVIEYLRKRLRPEAVIADIEARKAYGLKKYGTLLQPFNGRNALMDAYQENLDLVMYLYQDWVETQSITIWRMFTRTIDLCLEIRDEMAERTASAASSGDR